MLYIGTEVLIPYVCPYDYYGNVGFRTVEALQEQMLSRHSKAYTKEPRLPSILPI